MKENKEIKNVKTESGTGTTARGGKVRTVVLRGGTVIGGAKLMDKGEFYEVKSVRLTRARS